MSEPNLSPTFLNEATARDRAYDVGHSDGYNAGYDDGHADAYGEGYDAGYQDARAGLERRAGA